MDGWGGGNRASSLNNIGCTHHFSPMLQKKTNIQNIFWFPLSFSFSNINIGIYKKARVLAYWLSMKEKEEV